MKDKSEEITALIEAAKQARKYARAPYSGFLVGAAIQTKTGKIFTGANVESSSYGMTICAERVALAKALTEGEDDFVRIAVVTNLDPPAPPCGACRQLLWDYAPELEIILVGKRSKRTITTLREIFPLPFGVDN